MTARTIPTGRLPNDSGRFDLTTAIFVDQEQGTDLQGCETTALEQPRDQLEAVGAVLEVNGSEDGDDGILP